MDQEKKIVVTNLFIFPLKSGHELNPSECEVTKYGLINDRILVIIRKKDNKFLTIRTHPKIYEIKTTFNFENPNILKINIPESNEYIINLQEERENTDQSKIFNVKIWTLPCDVHPIQNEQLQKDLSKILNDEVQIVFSINKRSLKDYNKKDLFYENNFKESDSTNFADLAQLLITSEESLNFINEIITQKGEEPIEMISFRPNIVLKGVKSEKQNLEPFWEQKVKKIKISQSIFRNIKGCTRCKVTTFDTENKIFRKSMEPVSTLTDVNWDEKLNGVIFGQNFSLENEEMTNLKIKINDEVEILEYL